MNFGYNGYGNGYQRNYGVPSYAQPQYMQPQMPMQQQIVQQQPQPQQNMQPMEMPFNYFGYGNYKEVESHILFPNQKALFIDRANNMFYEKICNNDGISVISQYKRVDNQVENQVVEEKKEQPTIDLSAYATKQELGNFISVEKYNELLSRFEELKKIIGGKPNGPTTKQ